MIKFNEVKFSIFSDTTLDFESWNLAVRKSSIGRQLVESIHRLAKQKAIENSLFRRGKRASVVNGFRHFPRAAGKIRFSSSSEQHLPLRYLSVLFYFYLYFVFFSAVTSDGGDKMLRQTRRDDISNPRLVLFSASIFSFIDLPTLPNAHTASYTFIYSTEKQRKFIRNVYYENTTKIYQQCEYAIWKVTDIQRCRILQIFQPQFIHYINLN